MPNFVFVAGVSYLRTMFVLASGLFSHTESSMGITAEGARIIGFLLMFCVETLMNLILLHYSSAVCK
jgi:hypothetical protein